MSHTPTKAGGKNGGGGGAGGKGNPTGKGGAGNGGGGKSGGGNPGGGGGKGAKNPPGKGQAGTAETRKLPCYPASEGRCRHQNDPSKCKFTHRDLTAEEKRVKAEYDARRNASPGPQVAVPAEPCPAWMAGNWSLGDKCKNQHPKGKAKAKAKAKAAQ